MQQALASLESVEALRPGSTTNIGKESVQKTFAGIHRRCNEIGTPAGRFVGHPGVCRKHLCIT